MENWIIYYEKNYNAAPWPFAQGWDAFVNNPEPLKDPANDFGRVSLCDGLSETPSVPAQLPRALPQGHYQLALYHDPTYLYVFLEATPGPTIVSREDLRQIPHLAETHTVYPGLTILAADAGVIYRFGVDDKGQPQGRPTALAYGPRAKPLPAAAITWDFRYVPKAGGDLSCWRIARADLADAFTGNTLRLSISYMGVTSMESVAWGSQNSWGPRPDEMATVRLVATREFPSWPIVQRLELAYDPVKEQGRFRIRWSGAYTPDEDFSTVGEPRRKLNTQTHRCALRVNGLFHLLDLVDGVESPDMDLVDGLNRVQVSSIGGPMVLVDFEKRSGNRIVDSVLPVKPPADMNRIQARISAECQTAIREMEERRTAGRSLGHRWMAAILAGSFGRAQYYLKEDPRLLEVLRDEADCALALQRPDGTYGGGHLWKDGISPAPWAGGAYDTGPVGELWVVAHWLLGEQKYLEASRRLLEAYRTYPFEFNHNYAAFALYHLAAHYQLTREPLALERGLYYARHCVAVDILPLGYQSGHNYYSVYGAITLRGMALFARVLPETEPYRKTLCELCVRMANQLITRLQPNGLYDACDRFYLGEQMWLGGLFSVAFLLEPGDVARLDAVVQRMLHCPDAAWDSAPLTHLCESDFIRYLTFRDRLLAGDRISLEESW